jgi:hypothetical protein
VKTESGIQYIEDKDLSVYDELIFTTTFETVENIFNNELIKSFKWEELCESDNEIDLLTGLIYKELPEIRCQIEMLKPYEI